MEKVKIQKFIREYYGVSPEIRCLPTNELIINFGYTEGTNNYRFLRITVSNNGKWKAWTRYNEGTIQPVKPDYEHWSIFSKPGSTDGAKFIKDLCTLVGAKYEAYKEPLTG